MWRSGIRSSTWSSFSRSKTSIRSSSTNRSSKGSTRLQASLRHSRLAMRHDFVVPGFSYRLRPVTLGDADFIVALRAPGTRTRFLRPGARTAQHQVEWLEAYFLREGDYYFVTETTPGAHAEGMIGLYDVDIAQAVAEMGRWILRPGSAAAVESALLIYRFAFDVLRLD